MYAGTKAHLEKSEKAGHFPTVFLKSHQRQLTVNIFMLAEKKKSVCLRTVPVFMKQPRHKFAPAGQKSIKKYQLGNRQKNAYCT